MKGEILDMKDIDVESDMRTGHEERCGEGKPPRVLLGSGGNGRERDEKAAPTAEIDMRAVEKRDDAVVELVIVTTALRHTPTETLALVERTVVTISS
jgi:hypothetical protein